MLVKIKNLKDFHDHNLKKFLTVGKIYPVIGMRVSNFNQNYQEEASIIPDNCFNPTPFDLNLFDIVDDKVPNNWVLSKYMDELYLSPKEFKGAIWWKLHEEDLNEAEILARNIIINKIYTFHSLEPFYTNNQHKELVGKEDEYES